MKDYGSLAAAVAVLLLLFWITKRPPKDQRRPVALMLARLLRRAGRRLWVLGEALEVGFFHGRKVRDRIGLDLEATESEGEP
jgi:hypothetical protein